MVSCVHTHCLNFARQVCQTKCNPQKSGRAAAFSIADVLKDVGSSDEQVSLFAVYTNLYLSQREEASRLCSEGPNKKLELHFWAK